MIKIERTISTPELLFDTEKGQIRMAGESFPENAVNFYKPFMEALAAYLNTDFEKLDVEFELIYFNSSTSKILMNIIESLDKKAEAGKRVVVNWLCSEENDMIIECGEELGEDFSHLEFNVIIDKH